MPMIPVPLVSDSTSITCILCLVCTKTTNIIPTKRTWCNCKRMTNSILVKLRSQCLAFAVSVKGRKHTIYVPVLKPILSFHMQRFMKIQKIVVSQFYSFFGFLNFKNGLPDVITLSKQKLIRLLPQNMSIDEK